MCKKQNKKSVCDFVGFSLILITCHVDQIIASGPYTTADNMFFEPLSDLLAYAQRKQPQLLVLVSIINFYSCKS